VIEGRTLARDELERIWEIDRSEVIETVYSLVDGALALRRQHYDVKGWPPGGAEKYAPILYATFDRGGWFHGLFEGGKLIGVAVLDARFIGGDRRQLQLAFLHVGSGYRDRGLGRRLFELAADEARRRSARSLYISATESQHTVDFYLGLGCVVARDPDPDLFALEPEDIHLECDLGARRA
jgi:predicted N-acetyltransferase YhbS